MMLGVVLAEIALARPIQVLPGDRQQWSFGLCERDASGSNGFTFMNTNALLRLMDPLPLRLFQRAVAYCLSPNSSVVERSDFRAEDLAAYMANVIKP